MVPSSIQKSNSYVLSREINCFARTSEMTEHLPHSYLMKESTHKLVVTSSKIDRKVTAMLPSSMSETNSTQKC